MSSLPDLYTLIQNIDAELVDVLRSSSKADNRVVEEQEKLTKYILVATGPLSLAIAIDDLSEVGPLPQVTFLPNLPAWIQGIVNVRSEIISVVDLPGFLSLETEGMSTGNRFVVLQHRKQKIGVRLDRIAGTVSRGPSDTAPLDIQLKNFKDKSLFSMGLQVEKTLYSILNVRRFLTAPRLIHFNRAA